MWEHWFGRIGAAAVCLAVGLSVGLAGCGDPFEHQRELPNEEPARQPAPPPPVVRDDSPPPPDPTPYRPPGIALELEEPLHVNQCHGSFVPATAARMGVFRIASYPNVVQETYPSVLLHLVVDAASMPEILGQRLSGKLFVQQGETTALWYTADGESVEVQIGTVVERNVLMVELVGGRLHRVDGGPPVEVTGRFDVLLGQ